MSEADDHLRDLAYSLRLNTSTYVEFERLAAAMIDGTELLTSSRDAGRALLACVGQLRDIETRAAEVAGITTNKEH